MCLHCTLCLAYRILVVAWHQHITRLHVCMCMISCCCRFWPDGIYTAPSDAALAYDLQAVKMFGMNLVRKHQKVEPERWYYWADKLGIVIFQGRICAKSQVRLAALFSIPISPVYLYRCYCLSLCCVGVFVCMSDVPCGFVILSLSSCRLFFDNLFSSRMCLGVVILVNASVVLHRLSL
jgi:hypothetical protein